MKKLFSLACCLTLAGLLVVSCSSAVAPSPAPKATAVSVTTPVEAATPKPAAPSPSPKPLADAPRYGGILNISHPGDPVSTDPIQELSVLSVSLSVPSYSGIVQHDPLEPTKVIGDLAEKWDMSPDGLTYTFSLFKNVKFHDGTPFTSEDARFSLETVRKPPRGVTSPRSGWLKAVDKIEALDTDTLKLTLQYPSASFLHNLGDGRMVAVPKHIFEAKGNMKRDVVGTGPFRFKSFTSGTSYSVVKNPDYFVKGRPYLDGITWYIISDVATRFAALRTHRVQVTPWASQGLTPSQAEVIQKSMSDQILVDNYSSLVFLGFWMPNTKAPWNDVRVRRAVDMAIDRPNEIKVGMEGGAVVGGFMPPGFWSLPEAELMKLPGYRQPKDADIAEAKKLLAEAGYAQGFKNTIVARNVKYQENAALALKQQLAPLGIDITVRLLEQGQLLDVLYKRNFESAVYGGPVSYDDPDQVFGQSFITGVPGNYCEFTDEKIDKWYDEQARTLDTAKRKEIVTEMQRRMFELVPSSILHWQLYQMGRWKEVKALKAGIGVYNNLKFQDVWLAN